MLTTPYNHVNVSLLNTQPLRNTATIPAAHLIPTIQDILYELHDDQNLIILGDFNINLKSIVF